MKAKIRSLVYHGLRFDTRKAVPDPPHQSAGVPPAIIRGKRSFGGRAAGVLNQVFRDVNRRTDLNRDPPDNPLIGGFSRDLICEARDYHSGRSGNVDRNRLCRRAILPIDLRYAVKSIIP